MNTVLFNPATFVKRRIDVIAPTQWVHPQYLLREMTYVFVGHEVCPLLGRPARGLKWKLDKDLHMIADSVVVL